MDELVEILIVEDDSTIRTILEMALLGAGFRHVRSAANGEDGLAEAKRIRPDLILLDIMLPGMDGFSVCKKIRSTAGLESTRIIMLTARAQNEDIVRGLACGADDYVTKPFDRQVLLARVRAVLRRGVSAKALPDFDGLSIDESNREAVLHGMTLKLAPGEFRILALLAANRDRVLARQRILDAVLPDEEKCVTERTIDVQIATLRRKLGGWADHIETIRGVGYRVK